MRRDQHLHHAADFLVAADDRVQLAFARQLHQVAAVALQGLEFFLGAGVGNGLAAADLHQGLQEQVPADPQAFQGPGRGFIEVHDCQEQVFRGNVLVPELAGDGRGLGQRFFQGIAQVGFRSLHLGQRRQFLAERPLQLAEVDADLPNGLADDVLRHGQDGQHQVQGHDLLVAVLPGETDGILDGLVGLQRKLLVVHAASLGEYYNTNRFFRIL